jgi:hypothetical protein
MKVQYQHTDINQYMRQSWRIVGLMSSGAWAVSFGITSIFAGLGILPWWVSISISSAVSGAFTIMSAELLRDGLSIWDSKHSRIVEESSDIAEPLLKKSAETHVIEDGYSSLSSAEIRHLIRSSKAGGKMLRRHLDSAQITNLSRRWNDGEIRREAFRLGVVGFDGYWLIEPKTADGARNSKKSDKSTE